MAQAPHHKPGIAAACLLAASYFGASTLGTAQNALAVWWLFATLALGAAGAIYGLIALAVWALKRSEGSDE